MRKTKILKKKSAREIPRTYLIINKKYYRALIPEKALEVAKRLSSGRGSYKVRVVYGEAQAGRRKKELVENVGRYKSAREAKNAIMAFLNKDLWVVDEN